MVENQHVRVHSRCGACGFLFHPGDSFYAFSLAAFGSSTFPESGHCDNNHDYPWKFCRLPKCQHCHASPESAIVHTECLRIFRSTSGKGLRWLWLSATWKSPWQGALPLDLEPSIAFRNTKGLLEDLPRLLLLAPELQSMIWDFCSPCPLVQCTAVLDLGEMVALEQCKQPSVPLLDIESWSRGGKAHHCVNAVGPFIRLVFDWRGLQRIERLRRPLPRNGLGSDFNAFVVEEAECFSGVIVEFQLGLARLRLPEGEVNGFRIWDTPSPPPPELCFCHPFNPPTGCHLGTVQLGRCTGLTFFMAGSSLYAIHSHTIHRPSAQSTFESLPTTQRTIVSWLYVPIASEITRFCCRLVPNWAGDCTRSQSFLLSTGNDKVFIGDRIHGVYAAIESPTTLIHDKPDNLPIAVVGAYSEVGNKPYNTTLFRDFWPSAVMSPSSSSAPLERVSSILVYFAADSKICRGIVINYESGAQCALGQCKLGLDPVLEYASPRHLCFCNAPCRQHQTSSDGHEGVRVLCNPHTQPHLHNETCWTCCDMRGFLRFNYILGKSHIEHFEKSESMPQVKTT
ncbi:hypothetical protein RJ55_06473 [Drechmeria coniospora]|nr:hypothetical protein RJ55_06473 [Drechmeria coniospora]